MLHRDRTITEVRELLETPPLPVLSRVYVSVAVHGDTTQFAEVARVTSPHAEGRPDLERFPVENLDPLVHAIGDIQKMLRALRR